MHTKYTVMSVVLGDRGDDDDDSDDVVNPLQRHDMLFQLAESKKDLVFTEAK